jgi:hypothetical protein
MSLTKAQVRNLRNDMDKAMAEVLEKYGLEGSLGNIKFMRDGSSVTFQRFQAFSKSQPLKVTEVSKEGIPSAFSRLAPHYGLSDKHYGVTIRWGNKQYTVKGFEPNRPKWCIVVLDSRGTERLIPRAAIDTIKKAVA